LRFAESIPPYGYDDTRRQNKTGGEASDDALSYMDEKDPSKVRQWFGSVGPIQF
jgi:hypothetical protein